MDPPSGTAATIVLTTLISKVKAIVFRLLALHKAPKTLQVTRDKLKVLQQKVQKIDEALKMHTETSLATALPDVLEAVDMLENRLTEMALFLPDETELSRTGGKFVLTERAEQRLRTSVSYLSFIVEWLTMALSRSTFKPAIPDRLADPQTIFNRSPTSSAQLKPPMTLTEHVVSTPSPTMPIKTSAHECKCLCHEGQRLSTPKLLREVFGVLRIEIHGHPCSSPACSQHSCRKPQLPAMKADYVFPSWLLSRAIYVAYVGLSISLRVLRTCSVDAAIFRAIQSGQDRPNIKKLLLTGEASPNDIDPEGNTPLHIAVKNMQLESAEFLVQAGADIHFENFSGFSSFEIAWTQILANVHVWDEETLYLWGDLFNDEPRLEDFRFPLLHKTYLGICDKDFRETLAMTQRSELDRKDRNGRTILSWAAQRGDQKTMSMLLAWGSSPDEADSDCWTPLHMSCHVMNTGCIQLLLAAGADVNARTRDGHTLLFLVAERADRPDVIRMLLAWGAETDPQTRTGWRPLHSAARWNRPGTLRCLIEAGVQLDAKTRSGDTAITIAIASNSHESLNYLLKVTPAKLIQDAFRKTIAILQSAGLGGLHFRESLDKPALIELLRRAALRRDFHKERSETPLYLPDVDSLERFMDYSTAVEGVAIAGGQHASTKNQLIWEDTSEVIDGISSVHEDARDVNPDPPCPLEDRKEIELQCFKEPTSEPSKSENMAEKRCLELLRVTPAESHTAINKTILLLFFLLCLVPCVFWKVIAVKGLSGLAAAAIRHPHFVDVIGLLSFFGAVIHLSSWRTWRSGLEELDDGLAIEAISSRLNRGLLWISTPGFTIRLKPVDTQAMDDRRWAYNAVIALGVGDLSTRLRSTLSRFCRNIGISEPELEEGKCRVRWRCRCGRKLYDDYVESRPGAAKQLEKWLNEAYTSSPLVPESHSSSASTSVPPQCVASQPQQQLQGPINNNLPLQRLAQAYDPRIQHGAPTPTIIACELESRWLLICAKVKERPIGLAHFDICATSSDQQLFKDLKELYTGLRAKWTNILSLRKVIGIRFVQFELHNRNNVDIRKFPDMPPKDRKEEYVYQPCDVMPPLGENLMAHLLYHPDEANEVGITCLRAPKKRKQKLTVCPREGTTLGWGLHFVEGWAAFRVWFLTLSIFSFGSLVFGVCWAVLKHDLQGAFGVSAWMITLIGIVLGTLQAGLE